MKRRTVDPSALRESLGRILESDVFARSPQARRFLEFVVGEQLSGSDAPLKAYTIGVTALGANPERSSPETMARMQASRVRRLLGRYYESVGRDDPCALELPAGTYEVRAHYRDAAEAPAPSGDGRLELAIEPFAAHSEHTLDERFCSGLRERLTALLVHEEGLRISQGGAAYVLSGSLTRSGDEVRLAAELHAPDGATIWAEQYDRHLGGPDLLHPLDELALCLAAQIGDPVAGILARTQRTRAPGAPVDPVQAFSRYLAGPTAAGLAAVKVALERALPSMAERAAVHAAYSCVLSLSALAGREGDGAGRKSVAAETHARTALALDAECPLGHFARALVHFRRGEKASVQRELTRAVDLSPASATGRAIAGQLLVLSGQAELGLSWIRTAESRGLHLPAFLALGPCLHHLLRRGDPASALGEAERLEGPDWLVQCIQAACLSELGRPVEARRALSRALETGDGAPKRLERRLATVVLDEDLRAGLLALAGARVVTASEPPRARTSHRPSRSAKGGEVKVGILQSLSGPMAICETHMVGAAMLAIEEINAHGGILGQRVLGLVEDGASDPEVFGQKARKLVEQDGVSTIFGCWTSSSRKAVLPVVEAAEKLLWYPVQYEGLERSRSVIYTGSCLNQQIEPAVRWASERGARTAFLVGSDYVFPRTANRLVRGLLQAAGGQILGEHYVPLGRGQFDEIAKSIKELGPDIVLSTINGADNVAFFRALGSVGVRPEVSPVMSFSLSELELSRSPELFAGHLACWSYFQSLDSPDNHELVQRFRGRYGEGEVTSDPTVTAYAQVHLWKDVVTRAGTFETAALLAALPGSELALGGEKLVVSENHHVARPAVIGRARADGQFSIEWRSPSIIQPKPWLGVEEANFLARDLVLEALCALPEMTDRTAQLEGRVARLLG